MGPGFTHVGPGYTLGGPGFTLVGPGFIFVVDVTKFELHSLVKRPKLARASI